MKVAFLDVGQGDSIFIQAPNGKQMLIDGGRSSSILSELDRVMPFGDRSIDVIIATHPDADHIGGLVDVLRTYTVDSFIETQAKSQSNIYQILQKQIKDKNIEHILGQSGIQIVLDTDRGVYFDILYPDVSNVSGWDTNDASIIGKLVYGNTSILLTGDSPISKELYLVKKDRQILDVDILKLGHHGSRTSSSINYLEATSPQIAIISAGLNNQYGHPHKEVLDNLKELNIPYLSTYTEGTIICSSDAIEMSCR